MTIYLDRIATPHFGLEVRMAAGETGLDV